MPCDFANGSLLNRSNPSDPKVSMDNTLAQNPNDLFSIQSRPSRVWDQVRHFNRKLEPSLRTKKFSLTAKSSPAFFRATDHLYWADFEKSDLLRPFWKFYRCHGPVGV